MIMKRLFVTCRIQNPQVDRELAKEWDKVVKLLPPGGVPPKREPHIHITLRFLGDVDLADAKQVAQNAGFGVGLSIIAGSFYPIPLMVGYVGGFPGVAWCGVGGEIEDRDELDILQKRVDHLALALGFPPADFEFLPHITLGRFDRDHTPTVEEALKDMRLNRPPYPVEFQVGSIDLLESVRDKAGRVTYEPAGKTHLFRDVGGCDRWLILQPLPCSQVLLPRSF